MPEREHYCVDHQGNHSHYDPSNCTVCQLQEELMRKTATLEHLVRVNQRAGERIDELIALSNPRVPNQILTARRKLTMPELKTNLDIDRAAQALFSDSLPCNPRPFARALDQLVELNGSDSIRSDAAKQILWVLLTQAYGQLATIDLCAEWDRLEQARKRNVSGPQPWAGNGPVIDCGGQP